MTSGVLCILLDFGFALHNPVWRCAALQRHTCLDCLLIIACAVIAWSVIERELPCAFAIVSHDVRYMCVVVLSRVLSLLYMLFSQSFTVACSIVINMSLLSWCVGSRVGRTLEFDSKDVR